MNNNTGKTPESYPMNGGDGAYSYSNHSHSQRATINAAKAIIDEAIAEKLDLTTLSSTSSNSIAIADLGCSIGPNTFIAVQNILDAIKQKYQSGKSFSTPSPMPDFVVYFNDHTSNDFNTLFASLPPERQYIAAGLPGSFHHRLFPKSSIHFVYSSNAIHWLSKIPEDLLDKKSPAWNKGRVHYTNAPDQVVDAYAAQFGKDMEKFLDARATEIVVGGMMVILMGGIRNGTPHSHHPAGVLYDLLGATLMDMAKTGVIDEDQVDSFNLPLYTATPEEMTELVERNRRFSIERLEMMESTVMIDALINNPQVSTMIVRSTTEDIIAKHFGSGIMDQLCERFSVNVSRFANKINRDDYKGYTLLTILKRKRLRR